MLILCPALNNPFPSSALYISCPQLNLLSLPVLYNPLPLNNDTPKVPSNVGIKGKALPFFTSFLNVSVTPFVKTSEPSKTFTI